MESRYESRRKDYKKKSEDPRRKREELTIQIRKQSREAQLSKRRQQALDVDGGGKASLPSTYMPQHIGEELNTHLKLVMSNDPEAQLKGTTEFRRLLSIEKDPPIQQVIETGVISRLVEFLKNSSRPDLQFEAAWALTNIASGSTSQTKHVVDHGAIPLLVSLLSSQKDDVREQAVWALGNIAGDSTNFRDLVLAAGSMQPLLASLNERAKITMLRNATWTLSNLCRGKPDPPFELVSPALPALKHLIHFQDIEVLTDAGWALSYLSDGPNKHINEVVNSGVCNRLVELLNHPTLAVQTPALRAVGNIVTGDDYQTSAIIFAGALKNLKNLLQSPRRNIRKEACWTVSNITAGSPEQITEVIETGIIPILVNMIKIDETDVRKEAAWAIANAVSGGKAHQVVTLVDQGVIKPLCDVLDMVEEVRIVVVALEGLDRILYVGRTQAYEQGLDKNPYVDAIDAAGGTPKLEKLQAAIEPKIADTVVKIIGSYFPLEEDDDFEDFDGNDSTMINNSEFPAQFAQNVRNDGAFQL
eukprot:GHVP01070412.1.p1 GENE.GHVP01070412.1~~GHVP01070412.1.p1  ORF type:complete len:530 (+),score=90.79 GHVP01070412.1:31-1620(+)